MYRKESEGWFKHIDFILIDMICLQVAFYLSYVLKGLGVNPYADLVYRNMAIVLEFLIWQQCLCSIHSHM